MITTVLPQTTDPHPRGNTAVVNSIQAVLPSALSPLPRYYRGYRGNPIVPITVQLTTTVLHESSVAVCTECIVVKRSVLEQKLLLTDTQ